ncbi:uncharacterized protein DDB_G0287625-like [Culicoides brevitarsis]|uniref:uncharacterized protein DDB_G0287625-like n=1 Tax=Culicoides brevitarsis TaxID=469753 RepID=UPI00307C81C8
MANYVISYYLHLTLVVIVTQHACGIRVDFNTNTGPIVPPTSTQRPVPQPPFREPAPVWEDQSDDIPNPNPYRYIPPPPSRPRGGFDIFSNSVVEPSYNNNNNNGRYNNNIQPQSQVVGYQHHHPSSYFDDTRRYNSNSNNNYNVPSLSVRYIPNVGLRYYAVVPIIDAKLHHLQTNQVDYNNYNKDKYLYKREYFDKPNGKFNAKLKKYKAYEMEKQKFNENVPYNYYNNKQQVPRKSFDYVNNAPVSANPNNNNNNNNSNNNHSSNNTNTNNNNSNTNNTKNYNNNNSTKDAVSNKQ